MDYKGQQLCEYLYFLLTVLSGFIAWVMGYVYQDFKFTFYGWLIGLGFSVILCIPDWPCYNRNKVIWLDEVGSANVSKSSSTKQSKSVLSKGSKKN